MSKQTAGKVHTFKSRVTGEEDSGKLPESFGESNSFARWATNSRCRNGGYWLSVKLNNVASARYRNSIDLRSRMLYTLSALRTAAKRNGHKPPNTTPEEMAQQWLNQNGLCAACGGSIELIPRTGGKGHSVGRRQSAHFGHNHETGEAQGFLHPYCNVAEGRTNKMTDEEFENFAQWVRRLRERRAS